MKKSIVVLCFSFLIKSVFALPELAVPDLTYESGVEHIKISNADVKGAVAKSGKFKIIDVPKGFNTESTFDFDTPKDIVESSESPVIIMKKLSDGNQYVLIGHVMSSEFNDNTYSIANSTHKTETKSVHVFVAYKLVRLSDREIVASFDVGASASQTKIVKSGDNFSINNTKLLKELSADLAKQVVDEMTSQSSNSVTTESDKPIVSGFKTYD